VGRCWREVGGGEGRGILGGWAWFGLGIIQQ